MQFNHVALDFAQYIHQITRVKANFETVAAIFAGYFFRRRSVFGAGDGQGDLVLVERHFHGAGFFGCDGRDAVDALRKCLGVDAQQFVIRGRNDAAIIGEGTVDQL